MIVLMKYINMISKIKKFAKFPVYLILADCHFLAFNRTNAKNGA